MPEIRVALVGVGNSASALIQGTQYYKDAKPGTTVPGLMHVNFGGYHIKDIKFVAAFEVNKDKIGKDLAQAIFTKPNCVVKIAGVPHLNVKVSSAPIMDGVAPHMREVFNVYDEKTEGTTDVVQVLKDTKAQVLVNYLPVGSREATRFYAQCAMDAGCAFVNCMPEFIASNQEWAKKFEQAGLPVLGDDIKSQVGATILHRNLVRLCLDRGVIVDETYQLNLGGDTDFLNMTVEERLKTKRISKTEAVTSLVPYELPTRIGPSDYVHFLNNKKICYITLKGRKFGDRPITINVKLEVEDSPNSAGVVIDLIRAAKIALDRKIKGALLSMSSYAFKHPPIQVPEGLYYSNDFAWIKIEGDKVHMGITDYAQKQLREIVYAELPEAGTEVKQNEPYGTLESVKAVSDLVAAISGTIEEVNAEVKSQPELLNEDPYVKGWLVVVKPANLQAELANLMDFDKAVEWHKNQGK